MELSERKKLILKAVVDTYVEKCEPVGSKYLADYYNINLSPATIRSTMNELEQMGLLEQPHTSAGRIPSSLGYRVYVNNLMQSYKLTTVEIEQITENLNIKISRLDKIIEQAGKLISSMTALMSVSTVLNNVLREINESQIYIDGAANLLNMPEYHDLERAKNLIKLLDNKNGITEIFSQSEKDRLNIYIGEENKITSSGDSSFIFKTFTLGDERLGAIGVMGPKRMDYSRIIAKLEYFAESMAEIIKNETDESKFTQGGRSEHE